ncbi:uncharacterized protein LOC113775847 isoform X4 [Coffea eugenioides]|uniref:uncharacterized protein LOC113775847 isoform X4 n=1 Tax=Coffea eugenioides TaxID=49369 RepID=UPI000F61175E|nr:uncharacterized protein LOC113775847 isoform X4 [Coffea eugenioides]
MATATMAIFTLTSPSLKLLKRSDFVEFQSLHPCVQIYHHASLTKFGNTTTINRCHRESITPSFSKQYLQHLAKSVSAVRSGLEASIADPEENAVHVKNAKIVVESRDDAKLQVRVDLGGEETRLVFEKVLTNLARAAPPVPGFRRQKGGKTSKVPKDFLLQMLGEERVTNFVIQEIVSSTLADYTKKENLTVKGNKINTIQTAEELRSSFVPGKEFGFSATLELEILTAETSSQ